MTEETQVAPAAATSTAPKAPPPDLRLRPPLPTVMRLSRKTVGIASAVSLAAIGGAFGYALYDKGHQAPPELLVADGKTTADALAGAPKDYGDVPKLGTALPGDLGKPILNAQRSSGVAALPPAGPVAPGQPPLSPEASAALQARQRAAQERDAARISRLFLAGAVGGPSLGNVSPVGSEPAPGTTPVAAASVEPTSRVSPKQAFLDGSGARGTLASGRLAPPPDPHILQAGSIIPAALITGIDGAYLERGFGTMLDIVDPGSIQVLKGPQGTLWGRNATGGALLVNTADPESKLGGRASVEVGNLAHVTAEGVLNAPLSPSGSDRISSSKNLDAPCLSAPTCDRNVSDLQLMKPRANSSLADGQD